MEKKRTVQVKDRRQDPPFNAVWEVEPFDPATVTEADIGRTVIYVDFDGTGEAGTLSSFSPTRATFWARFSTGSTAAGCGASDLVWGVKQLELVR